MFALVGFIGLGLLVGLADGAATAQAVHSWYLSLAAPPGRPPNWVFAPVWSLLYVLIGLSGWLLWRRVGTRPPLRLWGWQLLVNALWAPAFFGLRSTAAGLVVLLPLLALIALTILAARRVDRLAAALLLPYAVWTCYATYLNIGFWWLN